MRLSFLGLLIFAIAALATTAPLARAADDAAPLDFEAALQLVVGGGTAVKQAEESAAGAEARADQTKYLDLPSVTATGASTRTKTDPLLAAATQQTFTVAADINVYRFGGDQAKRGAAQANAAAANYTVTATVLDSELKAAEALFDVISLEREREVAQGFVTVRRDSAAVTRRLYEKGVRPVQEAEKVEIDAANEEARLADTELRLTAARAVLAGLAGRPLQIRPVWPWQPRLAAGTEPAAAAKTPDFTQRADRRALAEKARALALGLNDIRARRLPSLDANLGYQSLRQTDPDARASGWTGTLTLTVPLFDRLAARADYEEQAHQQQIAQLDLEAKDRELTAGWDEARASLARALVNVKARDKTLAAARALYESSLKSFRSGMLSANELSLDQSRLYETELNAVHGWADVHRYYARLCRSLGLRLMECVKQ